MNEQKRKHLRDRLFFFQAEDGIRDIGVTGVQTCVFRSRLLFHDTHHRAATAPQEMARFDLEHFDGVLAFGATIRDLYLERGWAQRAWTWHEAADVRVFAPQPGVEPERDLVWIGNWRSEERRVGK